MTLADKVTTSRIILAPFFFIVYFLPDYLSRWFTGGSGWTVPVLWILFIISELTDLLDGQIARRRHEVSNFGKLYDPFADVLVRITYFLCFMISGIFPAFFLLLVLYREFGILFLRIMMVMKGTTMGARRGGKLKAVLYMAAGAVALVAVSMERLGLENALSAPFRLGALIVFSVSVVVSFASFFDYVMVYKKTAKD